MDVVFVYDTEIVFIILVDEYLRIAESSYNYTIEQVST